MRRAHQITVKVDDGSFLIDRTTAEIPEAEFCRVEHSLELELYFMFCTLASSVELFSKNQFRM